MVEPDNEQFRGDGRFKPGQSGNPAGKKPGTQNRTTRALQALLDGEAEEITRAAIDRAKAGDSVALRLCLERLIPARKDVPVNFELPEVTNAIDAAQASAAVLDAVANGGISPTEGAAIMALLTAHKSIVEAGDLEARIAALEEGKK